MIVTSHPEVILILTLEIGVQTEQFFLFALAANMLSSQLCCLMSGKDWKGTNVEDKKKRDRDTGFCATTQFTCHLFLQPYFISNVIPLS